MPKMMAILVGIVRIVVNRFRNWFGIEGAPLDELIVINGGKKECTVAWRVGASLKLPLICTLFFVQFQE